MKTYVFIITKTPYEGEYALSTINLAVAIKNTCSNCRVVIVFSGDGVYCLKKNQRTKSFSIEDLVYIAHSVGVEVYYLGKRGLKNIIELAKPISEDGVKNLLNSARAVMLV